MSDTMDYAQDMADRYTEDCIQAARSAKTLVPTGLCLVPGCGELLAETNPNKRFCDADCRDMYTKLERAKMYQPR